MSGFRDIGRTDEPPTILRQADDEALAFQPEHTGEEFVVECQTCPTTRDETYGYDRKREWVYSNVANAEWQARIHRREGHEVEVLTRTTYTFHLHKTERPGWAALLGLGDAGDHLRGRA